MGKIGVGQIRVWSGDIGRVFTSPFAVVAIIDSLVFIRQEDQNFDEGAYTTRFLLKHSILAIDYMAKKSVKEWLNE